MKNNFLFVLALTLSSVVKTDEFAIDPVPKVHLIHNIEDHETIHSADVDLTAEHVTPIFEGLKQRLQQKRDEENQRITQLDEYKVYKIQTEDNHNDTLLLIYTVSLTQDGLDFFYSVKLKTGNAYAEQEEDRVHEQQYNFQCSVLQPLNVFMCFPSGCDLSPFSPAKKPKEICEDNYVLSQVAIETVFEITKNTQAVEAFLECVENHLEVVTLDSSQLCYYVGFKNHNVVSKESLEQSLRDQGYIFHQGKWERYTEEYDISTVDRSDYMEGEDTNGVNQTTVGF